MATETTVRTFFSSPYFAVVGASSNPVKYGHKVFTWYLNHSLPVTAINPTSNAITAGGSSHAALPSLSSLPNPTETSVSIITPPQATIAVLREAKELGIPAVWMQPGSFDEEVVRFARGNEDRENGFKAVVAGEGGRGDEGWCVLVDGERGLRGVGKL